MRWRHLGYSETNAPENADLVILNTCHIREKAAEKVYSELGKMQANEAGSRRRWPRDGDRGGGLRCPG